MPATGPSSPRHTPTIRSSRRTGQTRPGRARCFAGAGLPFFPDVNVAAASALFDIHSMPGGRTIPSEMMLVRIAHPEAYFEKVQVSSTSIVASVLGEDLEDVYLQVSSAGDRHEERVGESGDIRVPGWERYSDLAPSGAF